MSRHLRAAPHPVTGRRWTATPGQIDTTAALAIRSCERKAEWLAFCLRHQQITSAHFVVAVLSSPTNARRLGITGRNIATALKQLESFVVRRALRGGRSCLPVMTRGLYLLLQNLREGRRLFDILSGDERYHYIVRLLEAHGLDLDRLEQPEAA